MAQTTSSSLVNDLIEAGIHFGQRSSNWNPKMSPYIYGKRNHIHIIDIKETVKGLLLAKKFVSQTVASGKDICFIGTKRQARDVIRQRVGDVQMHWVTERWLGGSLTNFRTIRSRLRRLEELERLDESGEMANYSKKMESQLRREKKKILRNLEGIRNMAKMPGAMVVVDVKREINAIQEARKLGIPTICLIDTDGDPDLADIPIPGNDDSMRSIDVVIRELCAAVVEGKNQRLVIAEEQRAAASASAEAPTAPQPARRSRRAMFSKDAPPPEGDEREAPPPREAKAEEAPEPQPSEGDSPGRPETEAPIAAEPRTE